MLCVLRWLQCELIEFYYHWKKTPAGMDTRAIRRQKKQQHIKTARQYFKLQQDPSQELGKSCLIFSLFLFMSQLHVQVRYAQQKRMKEMKRWKKILGMLWYFLLQFTFIIALLYLQ